MAFFLSSGPLYSASPQTEQIAKSLEQQVRSIRTIQGQFVTLNSNGNAVSGPKLGDGKTIQTKVGFEVDFESGYQFAIRKHYQDVLQNQSYFSETISATDGAIWKAYEVRNDRFIGGIHRYQGQPVAEEIGIFNLDDLKTGFLVKDFWTYILRSTVEDTEGSSVSITCTVTAPLNNVKELNRTAPLEMRASLSTAHGYWPLRIEVYRIMPARLIQSRVQFTEFHEYSPGQWIPTRARLQTFGVKRHLPNGYSQAQILDMTDDEYQEIENQIAYTAEPLGQKGFEVVIEKANLKINSPVDQSGFEAFFPRGTQVTDFTIPAEAIPSQLLPCPVPPAAEEGSRD